MICLDQLNHQFCYLVVQVETHKSLSQEIGVFKRSTPNLLKNSLKKTAEIVKKTAEELKTKKKKLHSLKAEQRAEVHKRDQKSADIVDSMFRKNDFVKQIFGIIVFNS